MGQDKVYSGEMTSRVSVYHMVGTKNAQGESIETETFLFKRYAQRTDAVGTDDEDGKLIGLAVCRYRFRYDAQMAANASALFIRDFDGDWDVVAPMAIIGNRNRYMELKCSKRGEEFTL